MNPSVPLFTADGIATTLQNLCDILNDRSSIPSTQCFDTTEESFDTLEPVRARLEAWVSGGEGVSGWLLTTEQLLLFPGTDNLPPDIPLHAELHRKADGASLNLRHTPSGWLWQEMNVSPEKSADDAFLEVTEVMIDPAHANGNDRKLACYQTEWRLTPAPGNSAPATFRPALSRFVGWK